LPFLAHGKQSRLVTAEAGAAGVVGSAASSYTVMALGKRGTLLLSRTNTASRLMRALQQHGAHAATPANAHAAAAWEDDAMHAIYIADGWTPAEECVRLEPHPNWQQLITVHDRATHSPCRPVMDLGAGAIQRLHVTHLFTDGDVLESGAPTVFARSVAARIVDLLASSSSLPSGAYVNAINSRGKAVCGVITGGTKLPLGAMV
jgi:hypothetical protein